MKATITKTRAVPKNLDMTQKEIGIIFEELIGATRVDLTYAYPKFNDMTLSLIRFAKLSQVMTAEYFGDDEASYAEFIEFQKSMVAACHLLEKIPATVTRTSVFMKSVTEEDVFLFTKVYNEFRESTAIRAILMSASRLKSFEAPITAKDVSFIYQSPGIFYKPFTFIPDFDVYSLRGRNRDDRVVKTWVSYMHQLFVLGNELAEKMQKPDIDIKKFCNTVITILTAAEKEPGLRDCREAFDTIKESMDLLEKNFSEYYKRFINTDKNSTSIFVSFIKDVSEKNKDAKIRVVRQFTKILNHYVEQMNKSGQKLDPQISELIKASQDMLRNPEE